VQVDPADAPGGVTPLERIIKNHRLVSPMKIAKTEMDDANLSGVGRPDRTFDRSWQMRER
jgi:hypothetical protein